MIDLDKLDIKILTELQRDACLTNVELAARVNLSPSPCLARVRMLKQSGLISKHVTLLDPRRLGLNVNVFIQITLEKQTRAGLESFERAVSALPQVMECYLMSGDADYLIRVVVSEVQALEQFIVDKLTRLDGVASIRIQFCPQAGEVPDRAATA